MIKEDHIANFVVSCGYNHVIERTIVGSVAIILLLAVSNVALATFEMMMRHT
ncbi:MAG: hypothetical protein GX667_04735 [Xanthomonadaceae bacterium]|nr:hypothetical protein [Xanthomonadaceae bacterium]